MGMKRLLLVVLLVGLVLSLLPGVVDAATNSIAITNRYGTFTVSDSGGILFYTYWTQQKAKLGDVRSNRWLTSSGRWRQRFTWATTEWIPASGSTPGKVRLVPPTSGEEWALNYINTIRRNNGRPALSHDPILFRAARWKSQDMITYNYFSHNSPSLPGSTLTKIRQYGKVWGGDFFWWGENLGKIYQGTGSQASVAKRIIDAMMAEQAPNDGHRKIILSSTAKRTGLGLVTSSSKNLYLSQEFSD